MAVAVGLAFAAPAFAQNKSEADKHDEQGKAYFRVGEFELAIPEFEKAYELDPKNTSALFNSGLAYEKLERYEEAVAAYRKYVEVDPEGNRVPEANARAAALERKIAARDAAKPKPEPEPEPAPTPPASTTPADTATPEPAPTTTTSPAERDRAPAKSNKKLYGLVLVGVGAVAIGAGVKFGLDAQGYAEDAEDLGPGDDWDQDIEDSGKAADRNMKISYAIGGAAVISGVVLYVLGRKDDAKRRDLAVVPTVTDTAATFTLTGRF